MDEQTMKGNGKERGTYWHEEEKILDARQAQRQRQRRGCPEACLVKAKWVVLAARFYHILLNINY